MSIWLKGGKRKTTGGKYNRSVPKKKMHLGRDPTMTKMGDKKINNVKALGSKVKIKALSLNEVNVYDAKKKKTIKAKLEDVMNNPANRHYIRMDVLTKGAILKTNLGFVKITNRPSQEGIINGVFTDFKEDVKKEKKK